MRTLPQPRLVAVGVGRFLSDLSLKPRISLIRRMKQAPVLRLEKNGYQSGWVLFTCLNSWEQSLMLTVESPFVFAHFSA